MGSNQVKVRIPSGPGELDSKMLAFGKEARELDLWTDRSWPGADGGHRGVFDEEN